MPELLLLESGRGRRRRNPRGRSAWQDAVSTYMHKHRTTLPAAARALSRRRRGGYKRLNPGNPPNPYVRGYYRRKVRNPLKAQEFVSVDWATDIVLASGGLLLTQKLSELAKQKGWMDVLVTALIGAGLGIGSSAVTTKDNAKLLAVGGGVAVILKTIAQFPQFKNLASPGSIVIGSPVAPARVSMIPGRMPVGVASLSPVRRL